MPQKIPFFTLMTGGDSELTHELMSTLPGLLVSPMLWHNYGCGLYGENFQLKAVGFSVELILENELPAVFTALRLNKLPIGVILDTWLRQCFLNILDFNEIEQYILFALFYGSDFIVYFCVSLICNIQEIILDNDDSEVNLFQKVVTHRAEGFYAGDYLPFMNKLSAKYRSIIFEYLNSLVNML